MRRSSVNHKSEITKSEILRFARRAHRRHLFQEQPVDAAPIGVKHRESVARDVHRLAKFWLPAKGPEDEPTDRVELGTIKVGPDRRVEVIQVHSAIH